MNSLYDRENGKYKSIVNTLPKSIWQCELYQIIVNHKMLEGFSYYTICLSENRKIKNTYTLLSLV